MPSLNEPKAKRKILIMGLPRSGKSSIRSVVFQKLSPNETLFLESTQTENAPLKFLDYEIIDCPATLNFSDFMSESASSLIFVIDAQDDYLEALQRLFLILTTKPASLPIVYEN